MSASMSSLTVAVSGMRAAQLGLSTTGHNISNSELDGYTRQQTIQQFSTHLSIGTCGSGSGLLQLGLGTDVSVIRQIRNKFLDIKYRDANTVAGYYSAKYQTGTEIETIIGELESDYKAQDVMSDVWDAINDLSIYPDGIETRMSFIETCVTFLDKFKNIGDNLYNYQINLNEQVKNCVTRINTLVSQIHELNQQIVGAELSGAKANDFRDTRNNLLDELSGLCDITIKESATGRVDILVGNGNELLVNGFQTILGLRYCNGEYPFVEPVFSKEQEILPADDTSAKALYPNLSTENLGGEAGNSNGKLKGLLVSRGETVANYTTDDSYTENFFIPKVQKNIDTLFHAIVVMLNDAVKSTDTDPRYDLTGKLSQTEIFSRITGLKDDPYIDRNVAENVNDTATLYSMYNVEINSMILETDGYNYLALSDTPDDFGDTTVINDLSAKWKKEAIDSEGNLLLPRFDEDGNLIPKYNADGSSNTGSSIDSYYREIIADLGIEVEEAYNYSEAQESILNTTENDRKSISGVSLDEELTSMLKYQHAYNAAARMVNVIDSLIDKVVNGTGRVGL